MAYEYEKENKEAVMINQPKANKEMREVYRKAKAFEEVKKYALSKNEDFEDRKDTARSNKEFNYFNTLQIANNAIINICKQLEDE
jgi:hypothetical protein